MKKCLSAFGVLLMLALGSPAAEARSDEDDAIRDHVKTLLKDKDAEDRAEAARWLGGRKQPEAVSALAKALSDRDAMVRQAAASALWSTGKDAAAAKPELEKALGDPVAAVVARAAGALASMGVPNKDLTDAWRRALEGSRDDATAFVAARGLIGIDPAETLAPPILKWLTRHAEDAANPRAGRSSFDDRDSAEAAANALERLLEADAAPVMPLLGRALQRSPESGRYILGALAQVKRLPPGTLELALANTGSPEADTRAAAIDLAGKLTAEREVVRWLPEATRLLGDRDESVRIQACWALRGVKGLAAGAAPELARVVSSDPSMRVRESAVKALEEVADAANPVSKASRVSAAASSKDALVAAMKSKDHDVAVEAVNAYNVLYLDTPEIVATLADVAVSGADAGARQRALLCLRNRQGQAKSALETIRPLMKSSDSGIAEDAKVAIEWIERGGAGSPSAIRTGAAVASGSRASSSRPPNAKEASREGASAPASIGNEERGLAVLRERKLEFNEHAFYQALSGTDPELIAAYLDAGMSPNLAFAGEYGRTPLMVVFFSGQACAEPEKGHEIVALLLKRGADVNQADEKKNTALMFAAPKCDGQTLQMLLKAGAKVNAKNWSGLTVLQGSIYSGNPGLEVLIAAGARLDAATAKAYSEAYKNNPKALELIRKATAK
jgi:HEAT repeat protein